ncbi:MAG: YihY/virulence factor BrkB family protein [Pseudomonadota bacterium]|nr:YihY/virulence factor BrkB family protein [Pseudomonadota bacterium]
MLVFVKKTISLARCAARHWSSNNASTSGAALAFFCAFSLAPLLVILLTLAGWIVGTAAAGTLIGAQLTSLFGPSTAKILLDAVNSSRQVQGLVATIISGVTLLISATTVLAALEDALEQIWRCAAPASKGLRGWIRARFLSLGFILTLGFLLLVSLTLSTGLSSLQKRVAAHHAGLVGVLAALDVLMSLLLVSCLFALIFRYMPSRRLPWKVVVTGGLLSALLFDMGRWGIGLYLAHSTQPTAFGAAASFAALLLWLYYSAQIFLFGAEFTACLGGDVPENQPRPPVQSAGTGS